MTRTDGQPGGFSARFGLRALSRRSVSWFLLALAVFGGAGAPVFGQLPNPFREPPPLIELQTKLAALGDFHGKPDGIPSTETTRAIRRFQIRSGLPVTGEADEETWRRIRLEVEQGVRDGSLPPEAAAPSSSPMAPPPGVAAGGPGGAPVQPFFGGPEPDATAARGPGGAAPEGPGAALRYSRFAASPEPVQAAVLADAAAALAARRLLVLGGAEDAPWLSPAFAAALREFQAAEGLAPSGVLDDPTLERLGLIAPEPEPGMRPVRPGPARRPAVRLPGRN